MAKTFVCNAFSMQMLKSFNFITAGTELTESEAREVISSINGTDIISAVGHPDTAAVLGAPMARINVKLEGGDQVLVCQLMGGRLPEGATTLPEGFHFQYCLVTVNYK